MNFCFKLGKTATETNKMLQKVYGERAVKNKTVFKWFEKFLEGNESLEDDEKSGLPLKARNDENIVEIKTVIRVNRRLTSQRWQHVFKTIELTRTLNDEVKDIVNTVIQRNTFFANPENILASMIHDDRNAIRELAWRQIKKARQTNKEKVVRHFRVHIIQCEATDYSDLINWQKCNVTEPPVTRHLTENEIDEFIENKCTLPFEKFHHNSYTSSRKNGKISD